MNRPDHTDDLILTPVVVPTRATVAEATRKLSVDPEIVKRAAPVFEAVAKAVAEGVKGPAGDVLEALVKAIFDYRRDE